LTNVLVHYRENGVYEEEEDDLMDEERLARMTELEREMELAERAERQQQKRQREELLRQQDQGKGGPRRSGRELREENKKKSAIEELKAARERKARGEKADTRYGEEEEDEEEGEEIQELEDLDDLKDDDEYGGAISEEDEEEASYQEVKGIQVRRYKLEEWFNKPFFEKTLPGCMVRLAAGNKKTPTGETVYDERGRPVAQYMVAKVIGLVEKNPGYYKYLNHSSAPWKSPYPFGPKGERTSLWLRVLRGTSEKIWPLAQVSNSSITEQEFFRYHQQCEQSKSTQVTRGQVEKVRNRLLAAENYVYTETDVAKLLESKRSKGSSQRNAALEKARLERERDAAIQRGDDELVVELDTQIQELRDRISASKKKDYLAELNKKNANINFKTTMMAEQDGDAPGSTSTQLDPFRRRATRPIVYWNTGGGNGGAEETVAEQRTEEEIAGCNTHADTEPDADFSTCISLLEENGVKRKRGRSYHVVVSRLFNINSDRRSKFASRKFLDDDGKNGNRRYSYYSISEYESNSHPTRMRTGHR
jgi:RNA polymerase-associated protein RTF1